MGFSIETPRLLLRDYRSEDWARVHLYGSSAEFCQFESWGPNTTEDTKNFIAQMIRQTGPEPRPKVELAICLKSNGLLIGGCTLKRESEQSGVASLGWAVNPEFQKMGYATEAAIAMAKYGFSQLQLIVIYAICDERNLASARVMEKLGMKKVGLILGDRKVKGHLRNTLRFEFTDRNPGACEPINLNFNVKDGLKTSDL
jgi:ribosomal-protein-alanine N-acetyltransferase